MSDIFVHGGKFVKCLLVGFEQFRYLSWKKRYAGDGRNEDPNGTGMKGPTASCYPLRRYWESRCVSCWYRIRPQPYHFLDRIDIRLLESLGESELCPSCRQEMTLK